MPPEHEQALAALIAMDPLAFEQHVMSFFVGNGLTDASATKRTSDNGIDGMARHPKGLIVVQCKHNAFENKVGGPAIQQFIGAMVVHNAWRGYFITTSEFTHSAREFAKCTAGLSLVDRDELLAWHSQPPTFRDLDS